jgi:hypothetical protein
MRAVTDPYERLPRTWVKDANVVDLHFGPYFVPLA